jgi:hypothetical protein
MASNGGRAQADPDNIAQVAARLAIYNDNCESCRGTNPEGQPNWRGRKPDGHLPMPPHYKNGNTWHHPDKHFFCITKFGVKPPLATQGYQIEIPAFEDVLLDGEIRGILIFYKNSWPPRERVAKSE